MARELTLATSVANAPRPSVRQLWQVPTFVAGLLAVLSLVLTRPFWQDSEARQIERTLATARQLLDEPQVAIEQVRVLAAEVLHRSQGAPQQAGQAHFLLGTAYLRGAELAPAASRTKTLLQARVHLEQAETLGVADSDRDQLAYRLGRAFYLTGADPRRVLTLLAHSIEQAAEDRADGYAMLTQVYLSVGDLNAALEANGKQLTQPTIQTESVAQARLLRGVLLFRLERADEAHKVLARIGPGAPQDLLMRARSLQAWRYQEAAEWKQAATLWKELLNLHPAESQQGRIWHDLGLCHQHLGRLTEAAENWTEAMRHGGEEGQAAALRLAGLRLKLSNDATALELYEQALHEVTQPADYRNTVLSLAEAHGLVESSCRVYRDLHAYAPAQRLARLSAKLVPPRTAQALVGQIAEDWARANRDAIRPLPASEADRRAPVEVWPHFREAAVAYTAVAEMCTGQPEQAEWWQRGADCYLEGHDFANAVTVLERLVHAALPRDRLAEAWYKLAEAQRACDHETLAEGAYGRCIAYDGPFAPRARLRLAQLEIARGRLDVAEEGLKHLLKLMPPLPDREVQEPALFALANLLYQRAQFGQAEHYLEQALQLYRTNPGAVLARFQLGECYRQLARQTQPVEDLSPRDPGRSRLSREWLEKAVDQYSKVMEALQGRPATNPFDESEVLLRQTLFAAAECYENLGQLPGACRLYESLLQRQPPTAERLLALQKLCRCYALDKQTEKAFQVLTQLETAVKTADETAFHGAPDTWSRKDWDQWLKVMRGQ
jgi:tetratricopeptide (TPR) repeat protein